MEVVWLARVRLTVYLQQLLRLRQWTKMIQIIQRQKIFFTVITVAGKKCVKIQMHMRIARQPNSVMGKIQNKNDNFH